MHPDVVRGQFRVGSGSGASSSSCRSGAASVSVTGSTVMMADDGNTAVCTVLRLALAPSNRSVGLASSRDRPCHAR